MTSDAPLYQAEIIAPPTERYPSAHGSTVAELPDGTLLAAWYGGSEEGARDVVLLGSRKPSGARSWSAPQVLAEDPGQPEGNPVLFAQSGKRVWLFYVTMYDHGFQWDRCKVKCKVSGDGGGTWGPERILKEELGWMTRNKAIVLPSGEWLLPVYDERDWSCMVMISADAGETWAMSASVPAKVKLIQPTLARLPDGSILAYMRRGEGAEPRIWRSRSGDGGRTWSAAAATDLPNPNAGADMVMMNNGHLVLAYNDSESERTPLTLAVSTDQGKTWPTRRDLESEPGEYSYPAIIQGADGAIHVTYTFRRESIKHVRVNEQWIASGR